MTVRHKRSLQITALAAALLMAASLTALILRPGAAEPSPNPIEPIVPAELASLVTELLSPIAPAMAPPANAHGVGLVDPTQGLWHLRTRGGDPAVFYYGNPGDFPIVGDWDCDGVETPGMYRQSDGFVYLRNSNTQGIADTRFFFGNPGDIPLAGDFDGDGCDTVSIYRPSEGRVFIINKLGKDEGGLGAAELDYFFGNPGDKPFVGDFNGNGEETIGLHRESTGLVYFRNTHTQGIADNEFIFGDPGDRLVAGDWTGNDKASPALFRPSNQTVFLRYTNTQGIADEFYTWGASPWIPVAGRFGPLNSGVAVNLAGAPTGLNWAVESLYLELPSAPHLPAGMRSNLAGLPDGPKSQAVNGTASTATAYGKQVAVVTTGGDTILAVSDDGAIWRVVGAHLASHNRVRWYGGSPRFVAFIGADWQCPGGKCPTDPTKTHADSVHIVSMLPATATGAIVGIPRDTLVQAPYGQDKLNVTMRGRSPAVTTEALRTETGIPLEGYFHTGYGTPLGTPPGFIDLVDDFGGLPFLVPYSVPGGVPAEGDTFVDGPEALSFARERMTLPRGDVDRTLGHGLLMKAAIAEVKKLGIHSLPGLLAIQDNYVTTDLSIDAVLTLGAALYVVDPGPMPTLTGADLDNLGSAAYDQNPGTLPNVVTKGCWLDFGGEFAFRFVGGNYGTFADLADGKLDTLPVFEFTGPFGGAC